MTDSREYRKERESDLNLLERLGVGTPPERGDGNRAGDVAGVAGGRQGVVVRPFPVASPAVDEEQVRASVFSRPLVCHLKFGVFC